MAASSPQHFPTRISDEPSIADLSVYAMLVVLEGGPIPGCREAIAAFLDRMSGRIKSLEQPTT